MKNYFSLSIPALATFALIGTIGCKKDAVTTQGSSLTEEFQQVYTLDQKGWVFKDNTKSGYYATAAWIQGMAGTDKTGAMYGFPAFSKKSSDDEYAYSAVSGSDSSTYISAWMITPVLSVKNGDVLSFYTRSDEGTYYTDRLQVLINHSASSEVGDSTYSVGEFTTVLFDINPAQTPAGYPQTWTKYEFTFTGYAEKADRRIAFRHYVENAINARGVGVDLFEFRSK
jgi:hypothetical protein